MPSRHGQWWKSFERKSKHLKCVWCYRWIGRISWTRSAARYETTEEDAAGIDWKGEEWKPEAEIRKGQNLSNSGTGKSNRVSTKKKEKDNIFQAIY